MARCERCGKNGCDPGGLCHACRTQLTYHYVTKNEMKRPKDSLRAKLKAWWWPINPNDRRRHEKMALIGAALIALTLIALLIFVPRTGGRFTGAPQEGPAQAEGAD